MRSSTVERRSASNFENVGWLFFGGSFAGLALLTIAFQFHGWPGALFTSFGASLLLVAFKDHKYVRLIITCVAIGGIVLIIAGQVVGQGVAILASAGIYGPDHSSITYTYIENYLVFAIFWLVFGVPHRAFKYRLDQDGMGNAQSVLVGFLVTAAAILTALYILMLHFGGGPLHKIDMKALISGTIFTVVLIMPAYRSISKACWQRGILGLISPKPLAKRWSAALAELDEAFYQAAIRFMERKKKQKTAGATVPHSGTAHRPASNPKRRDNSSAQRNSMQDTKKIRGGGPSQGTASGQQRGAGGSPQQRNTRQRTKKVRGGGPSQRIASKQRRGDSNKPPSQKG